MIPRWVLHQSGDRHYLCMLCKGYTSHVHAYKGPDVCDEWVRCNHMEDLALYKVLALKHAPYFRYVSDEEAAAIMLMARPRKRLIE